LKEKYLGAHDKEHVEVNCRIDSSIGRALSMRTGSEVDCDQIERLGFYVVETIEEVLRETM